MLFFCVILSMYGGGFATVPAYLADMFGTQFVGAIHGRLLTAWSTAGIVGPVRGQLHPRVADRCRRAARQLYDVTMYILAGLLAVGFIGNLLIRPLARHWFMDEAEVAALQARRRAAAAWPGRLVRHRPRRPDARRRSLAWPSSASRSCGASGSRSRRP